MRFGSGDELAEDEHREVTLKMEVFNLTEEDKLGFSRNGTDLVGGKQPPSFNDCSIECALAAPPLQRRKNELEVHLKRRNPLIGSSVQIGSLQVAIGYNR